MDYQTIIKTNVKKCKFTARGRNPLPRKWEQLVQTISDIEDSKVFFYKGFLINIGFFCLFAGSEQCELGQYSCFVPKIL